MIRRISLTIGMLLALMAGAIPAQADFFAVAGVGSSQTKFSPTDDAWIIDTERSFEVGIGYAFSPYFSIQGGYHDFGRVTGQDGCPPDLACIAPIDCPPFSFCRVVLPVPVDVSGWSARLTGSVPFAGRFAAFASLGLIAWDTSAPLISSADLVFGEDLDDSGENLIYSGGLRWNVSGRWSLEVAYEEVDLDIKSTKLGAMFHF